MGAAGGDRTAPEHPSSSFKPHLGVSPLKEPITPPALNLGVYLPAPGCLYKILIKCLIVTYRGRILLHARREKPTVRGLRVPPPDIPSASLGEAGSSALPPGYPAPSPTARPGHACGAAPLGVIPAADPFPRPLPGSAAPGRDRARPVCGALGTLRALRGRAARFILEFVLFLTKG